MAKSFRHSPDWGGKREGAGRPDEKKISLSVTIPVDLFDAIEKEALQLSEPRSTVVERYLRKAMGKRGKKK